MCVQEPENNEFFFVLCCTGLRHRGMLDSRALISAPMSHPDFLPHLLRSLAESRASVAGTPRWGRVWGRVEVHNGAAWDH
jgi:hypothetical protein